MHNFILNLFLPGFLSLFISLLIGRLLYKSNLPVAILDIPNKRKIHTNPTPLIGGITILFSSLFIMLLFNLFNDDRSNLFIIFGMFFFFIGFFDDLFDWDFKKKIILQILGVFFFLSAVDLNIEYLTFSTITSEFKLINYLILGLWMLLIINAFNFFDGINFLAGSLSIVFFVSYAIFFNITNELLPFTLMVILIFAIFGFLMYNRAPAKMFLGDAGSMFLGFTIAGFPIIFSPSTHNSLDITFPVIVSFILISDTLFVVINRIKNRKNPFYPDKTHLHHQLLNLIFRNRYVVLIILIGSILHSLLAFKSSDLNLFWLVFYLIILQIVFIILPRFLPALFAKYNLWDFKTIYDKMINNLQKK